VLALQVLFCYALPMRKLIVVGVLGGLAALLAANAMGEPELAKGRAFGRSHTANRARFESTETLYESAPYIEWLFQTILAWTDTESATVDSSNWERWHHESINSAVPRYANIASDLATICKLDDLSSRQALDLLAIAYEESGFDRLVDDGTCNSPELLKLMPDVHFTCDHGAAHSIWQIHDSDLTPDDRMHAAYRAAGLYEKTGFDMWTTGRRAEALAEKWWAKHPFVNSN
jgi:hypothetical protein